MQGSSDQYLQGGAAGSVITALSEGSRSHLAEIQALVTSARSGTGGSWKGGSSDGIGSGRAFSPSLPPRRQHLGLDGSRLSMLAAVLDKLLGTDLGKCNIFLNLAGGVRAKEDAHSLDLAVAAALLSARYGAPVKSQSIFIGEIGLTGEVRSVGNVGSRVAEAVRMGFQHVLVPAHDKRAAVRQSSNVQDSAAANRRGLELADAMAMDDSVEVHGISDVTELVAHTFDVASMPDQLADQIAGTQRVKRGQRRRQRRHWPAGDALPEAQG